MGSEKGTVPFFSQRTCYRQELIAAGALPMTAYWR